MYTIWLLYPLEFISDGHTLDMKVTRYNGGI